MYLIVGLGNPEEEYSKTRHNMGFNVINKLADEYKIEVKQEKFQALFGSGMIGKNKVILYEFEWTKRKRSCRLLQNKYRRNIGNI